MSNVLHKTKVASKDIDAWNRSAESASVVENGNIVVLTTLSTTDGEGELFTAVVPSTGNGLTGVWMVGEPDVNITASKYKGLDPDPRNFSIPAGTPFSVFKPQLGDLVMMTDDGLAGTKSTNTFVNATDTTGGLKPVWGSSKTASVFSMKLLETTYISIGTGAVANQRVTAYLFEVVGL